MIEGLHIVSNAGATPVVDQKSSQVLAHATSDRALAKRQLSSTPLTIAFGGYSGQGRKDRNDDALAARIPDTQYECQLKGVAACISDGISVSDRSHIASQMSVTQFINDYYATPESWSVDVSATRVLKALNDWLCGQSRHNQTSAMVTTFSAVILKSQTFHIFHIGDSAIYRLRGGKLRKLTRDHNLSIMNKAAVLTAALGMDPNLKVDYAQVSAEVGDVLLLLTDGVTSVLGSKELCEILSTIPQTGKDLDSVSKKICLQALRSGSNDNITCGLLHISSLPVEDIGEAHRRVQSLQIPPVMKAGHKIDNFEISKVLYSGTRSHIYAAKQMLTNKQYILKVPSLNFRDDLVYLEGFIREQWVGRRLEHKGVMRIYAPIEDSPFLYHICEPVQGQTLRDWRIDHPNPTVDEVRDLLGSIIPALRAFHRMGMVHRDIKPENIMISHQGEVKIIDFGTIQVAGMEEIHSAIPEEHILGSVNYSAPEYVLGQKATPQSDLFSLGCVIYELLCGRRPFADTNPNLVNKAHSYGSWSYQAANAVRADIPMWIDEALKKACAPNPAHRYGLLSEFMADFTSPGQDARRREFKAPLIERNPIAFWKGLSAFLTILIAVLWVVIMKNVS